MKEEGVQFLAMSVTMEAHTDTGASKSTSHTCNLQRAEVWVCSEIAKFRHSNIVVNTPREGF